MKILEQEQISSLNMEYKWILNSFSTHHVSSQLHVYCLISAKMKIIQ